VFDKGEAKAAFALFAATDGKVTKKHLTKGDHLAGSDETQ
jgi:hypothetical protein